MDFIQKKSACIYVNPEFMIIETLSGYRRLTTDPDAQSYQLSPNANPSEVGVCLLKALAKSRLIDLEEAPTFFNRDTLTRRYENWIANLSQQFDYPSKRALFNKMRYCSVDEHEDFITIKPTFHDKLEGFSGDGIEETDYVRISSSSPSEDIGQAVSLALNRCTGKGAI